jgi:hypothetical protein
MFYIIVPLMFIVPETGPQYPQLLDVTIGEIVFTDGVIIPAQQTGEFKFIRQVSEADSHKLLVLHIFQVFGMAMKQETLQGKQAVSGYAIFSH